MPVPGVKGTTMRTGRAGHPLCAHTRADIGKPSAAAASAITRRRELKFESFT